MSPWVVAPDWMTDAEIDALVVLTERPEAWPAEHRARLPALRDICLAWQAQRRAAEVIVVTELSVTDIERRLGA